MKITVLTARWKRKEVFRIFIENMKHLRQVFGIDLVIAGEENDELIPDWSTFVNVSNDNLTDKWNAGARTCRGSDYVIMLGSDDIMSDSLMYEYKKRMIKGIDYIYFLDCYFYHIHTKQGLYWAGYRQPVNRGHACGAGRVLSKRMLNAMDWEPWLRGYERVLDTGMDKKIAISLGDNYTKQGFMLKDTDSFLLDIKSPTNMTPFMKWDNSEFINIKPYIEKHFNYLSIL